MSGGPPRYRPAVLPLLQLLLPPSRLMVASRRRVDVVPVAEVPMGPPPVPVAAGLGINPLLLGLAALAAGISLYFAARGNHSNSPV